jgi:anionic cell wall polymer biosynthesis LytR-Cps2A-Psr (LCP) family protein
LLGVDTGDLAARNRLFDSMVSSQSIRTPKTTLLSIPRDTHTEIVASYFDKITAYAFGGTAMSINTSNRC